MTEADATTSARRPTSATAPGHGWATPSSRQTGSAAGVVGGAVIAGAIVASRPRGYVVYPGYAQPVYGAGCCWASQPVYDGIGRVVGYAGRPVQVCPGYVVPPPAAPGYVGSPPVTEYAGPPPTPPPVELPPK